MARPILIAEDSENDIILLQRCLKKARVANSVVVLRDGDEVLAYLKGEGEYSDRKRFPFPSVLLLDLKMPRTSGFKVLKWCQSHPDSHDLLVVVLSAYNQINEINRAYSLGAHSFLIKPCNPEDLLNLATAFPAHWEFKSGR